MINKNAFTLAEVLITLGIIGVIAAMTMPTLMNNTNGVQFTVAYKKALSVLNQAVVLNLALDDYDLSQATTTGSTDTSKASLYAIFKNRMNVIDTGTQGEYDITIGTATQKFGKTDNYTLYFNDGIAFTFPSKTATKGYAFECTETHPCYGLIDVNGPKNPNKMTLCDNDTMPDYKDNRSTDCNVSSPADIYPVIMFDQSVIPTSAAAKAVLYGK